MPVYDFPDARVVNHAVQAMPLRVSTLRALGAYLNVFAIESFMDELAHAAGADPVEFRLRHLEGRAGARGDRGRRRKRRAGSRARRATARAAGASASRATRTSATTSRWSPKSAVEEVVRVPRVVAAIDCGRVVNPDGVVNQAEGGVIQAVSWTLKERVRFDRARVTTRNWDDYPILTFDEAPLVEVVLLDRPDEPSLGVGEGMMGPTAAAIGNAVFNAIGVRVRDLPLTRERVVAAINAR